MVPPYEVIKSDEIVVSVPHDEGSIEWRSDWRVSVCAVHVLASLGQIISYKQLAVAESSLLTVHCRREVSAMVSKVT